MALPFRIESLLFRTSSFARTSRQLSRRCIASHSKPMIRSSSVRQCKSRNSIAGELRSRFRLATTAAAKSANLPTPSFREEQHEQPLPAYTPPSSGLLSRLPPSWVPYAELIRLDKPAGTYYLFLPCLFSTLLAAPLTSPIISPSHLLSTCGLFFAGALVMRGAGCTINDLWDRNLDPHVARTRLRPIARGAVTPQQALPYLGVQLLSGLAILLQFPPACLWYGVPSLALVATYPLAKRVTNYPQAVLGLTFSWGAFMGFPALGIDLLADHNMPTLVSAACLYASCVAWTLVYDMIYAYQDIRDDRKAGIKSIALAQEKNAKAFLSVVSAVQVGFLTAAGFAVGAGPLYFAGTCGGAAATLGYMVWKVKLQSVKDCWAWFRKGAWFTGGAISLGLLGEYLMKYLGSDKDGTYPERDPV